MSSPLPWDEPARPAGEAELPDIADLTGSPAPDRDQVEAGLRAAAGLGPLPDGPRRPAAPGVRALRERLGGELAP